MYSNETVDIGSLDDIFHRMVGTITDSKDEVFMISTQSRSSFEAMQKELEEVRAQLSVIIYEGDKLEQETQLAKKKLVTISQSFQHYTEEQVKEAYETANDFQVRVSIIRTEEKQLRDKRDDLERRMKGLYDTIERADHIANQVNVVLSYLTTELKNVGLALEQAKAKQEFGIRILEAQEEERRRISREIHDGPAQLMANVLMRADLIERTYRERGIEQAIEEIANLKSSVRSALAEVRRIIYDLRPMALDDLGIIPALKKYLLTVEHYNPGVTIHFNSNNINHRLSSNLEVSIFRLVQESVNNALKHSHSKEIHVSIQVVNSVIDIIVKDKGIGFDPNTLKNHSFGITGMQERVDILKGTLEIESSEGKGTVVYLKIPLNSGQ